VQVLSPRMGEVLEQKQLQIALSVLNSADIERISIYQLATTGIRERYLGNAYHDDSYQGLWHFDWSAPEDGEYWFKVEALAADGLKEQDLLSFSVESGAANTQRDLDNYQKLWLQQGYNNYSVVFQRLCFCIPDVTRPAKLIVRDGQVESANYVDSAETVASQWLDSFLSIEAVFSLIAEAIASGAERIDVSYDEALGYPKQLYIDYSSAIADDELQLYLSDLVPLRSEVTTSPRMEPVLESCVPYEGGSADYDNRSNKLSFVLGDTHPPQVNICLQGVHNNTCTDSLKVSEVLKGNNNNNRRIILDLQEAEDLVCGEALTAFAISYTLTSTLATGDYKLRFRDAPVQNLAYP
ncbi:MAG: DUF6174 domain-containing protein, partial [Deinococcales bacterium]